MGWTVAGEIFRKMVRQSRWKTKPIWSNRSMRPRDMQTKCQGGGKADIRARICHGCCVKWLCIMFDQSLKSVRLLKYPLIICYLCDVHNRAWLRIIKVLFNKYLRIKYIYGKRNKKRLFACLRATSSYSWQKTCSTQVYSLCTEID